MEVLADRLKVCVFLDPRKRMQISGSDGKNVPGDSSGMSTLSSSRMSETREGRSHKNNTDLGIQVILESPNLSWIKNREDATSTFL
jgi:hypothetical protein